MRLRCRLNYHKWGRWSRPWYVSMNQTNRAGEVVKKTYLEKRSLLCAHCGLVKHMHIDTWSDIGSRKDGMGVEPIWED